MADVKSSPICHRRIYSGDPFRLELQGRFCCAVGPRNKCGDDKVGGNWDEAPMLLRADIRPKLWSATPVAWEIADCPVLYPEAVRRMEQEAAAITEDLATERVWLVEHPPLYTAGTSARLSDLIEPERFPVFPSGRGGQYTYHGPGQRVGYVMLDLRRRGSDVRAFVAGLEQWLIDTLAQFGILGERREDRVGVWVRRGPGEAKIAAIGIRVRRWVTYHGVSLNVSPDLTHFSGIVPCGVIGHGMTSLADLGVNTTMAEADTALQRAFVPIFGPVTPSA